MQVRLQNGTNSASSSSSTASTVQALMISTSSSSSASPLSSTTSSASALSSPSSSPALAVAGPSTSSAPIQPLLINTYEKEIAEFYKKLREAIDPSLLRDGGSREMVLLFQKMIPKLQYLASHINNINTLAEKSKFGAILSGFSNLSDILSTIVQFYESAVDINNSTAKARLVRAKEKIAALGQTIMAEVVNFASEAADAVLSKTDTVSFVTGRLSSLSATFRFGNLTDWYKGYQQAQELLEFAPTNNNIDNAAKALILVINRTIRNIVLAIDEIEMSLGLKEGFVFELLNDWIFPAKPFDAKVDLKQVEKKGDTPQLSSSKQRIELLIGKFYEAIDRFGFAFDPEDQFPFHTAILAQRQRLLKWEIDLLRSSKSSEKTSGRSPSRALESPTLDVKSIELMEHKRSSAFDSESSLVDDTPHITLIRKRIASAEKDDHEKLTQIVSTHMQLQDAQTQKALALINSKLAAMRASLNSWMYTWCCFSTKTIRLQIAMLETFKKALQTTPEPTYCRVMSSLDQDGIDTSLLFNGDLKETTLQIRRLLSKREDYLHRVQQDINELVIFRDSPPQEYHYFGSMEFVVARINALNALKNALKTPGNSLLDALESLDKKDQKLLTSYHKSMLQEIDLMFREVPDALRDKKLLTLSRSG